MTVDRFVVDTNVLISAALSPKGTPAELLEFLRCSWAVLVFSEPTMAELRNRLMQEKFDAYVDRAIREQFLAELDAVAEFVSISERPMGCRDSGDDKFLETALLSDVTIIVSGDRDLLSMHPFQGIDILSPAEALIHLNTGFDEHPDKK